jgi:CoA:oxalate CoA-transferase
MFADLPSAVGGTIRVAGSPVHYSRTPVDLREGADSPGGHTDAILEGELGLNPDAIAALREQRAIG